MDMVELHRQIGGLGPPRRVQGPHAIKTPLGWCVVGPVPIDYVEDDSEPNSFSRTDPPHCFTVFKSPSDDDDEFDETPDDVLHRVVHRSICTETLGTKPNVVPVVPLKEKKALDFVKESFRLEDSVCIVGLPWVRPGIVLPNNKEAVLRAFYRHEKKLLNDPEYGTKYHEAITKNTANGFARKLTREEAAIHHPRIWYIHHHGVVKPYKPDKVRPVMDASFEHHGTSLNKYYYYRVRT